MNFKEYQKQVIDEYGYSTPKYCDVLGLRLPIPVKYKGNSDIFVDDLLHFMDKRFKKYEDYNAKHPDAPCYPREIKSGNVYIIPSFEQTQKGLSDEAIINSTKDSIKIVYSKAVKKALRARKEHPDKNFAISMNKDYLSKLDKLHYLHCLKETSKAVGKGVKFTAKQTAHVLSGALGALPAATYHLLNKKYHFAKNRVHGFIQDKAIPYIRKGALKALIVASTLGAVKVTPRIAEASKIMKAQKEAIAQEKQEMQNFFAERETQNQAYFNNYSTAKEHEKEIVCLIAAFESYRSTAYKCQAGELTIGYGSRRYADGRKVKNGDTTTKEKAYEDVVAHLEKYVYPQFKHINCDLSPSKIAAVCMFVYNTDEGNAKNTEFFKQVNSQAPAEKIREALSLYRSVGGERSYGLIDRHGFEGFVLSEDIPYLLTLKRSIVGSPDMKYYEGGRDPVENPDGTFKTLSSADVKAKADKFIASSIEESILGQMPEAIKTDLIREYGYEVVDGKLTATKNLGNQNQTQANKTITFYQAMKMAANNAKS